MQSPLDGLFFKKSKLAGVTLQILKFMVVLIIN
jgi:hypothetical protein